ncbi:hypothetical protein GGTG_12637 [Gaeumannomyces tritici R3-111a-1]|uniref:Uncharacterized protein n=1 Tax=Gaeumannomyces tritici (strain R3-111a-1) TaxID=644352 RepID=J3PGK8_GAET3|nr:hypothetical protein GGTG_12637 [Gaeumannomyces tritici R3-111a-1]EJT69754.1 hypothetical protein GGTG_12637 [Gaeumannomyces tritici R3-111a-1]
MRSRRARAPRPSLPRLFSRLPQASAICGVATLAIGSNMRPSTLLSAAAGGSPASPARPQLLANDKPPAPAPKKRVRGNFGGRKWRLGTLSILWGRSQPMARLPRRSEEGDKQLAFALSVPTSHLSTLLGEGKHPGEQGSYLCDPSSCIR